VFFFLFLKVVWDFGNVKRSCSDRAVPNVNACRVVEEGNHALNWPSKMFHDVVGIPGG